MDWQTFDRRFDIQVARAENGDWWRDLLRLWQVPGHGDGIQGDALRLAVRDGTLNFYRCGQSVAQVRRALTGGLIAEVHGKYCGLDDARGYLRWPRPGAVPDVSQWSRIAREHADAEKIFVERLVAADPAVVDLEIGLPGFAARTEGGRRRSLRIDLAVLEPDDGGWVVCFWEVKLERDARLVRRHDPQASDQPEAEVLRQMRDYDAFLGDPDALAHLTVAYRRLCQVTVALSGLAASVGGVAEPSPAVRDVAAGASLRVDPQVRLLIAAGDDRRRRPDFWRPHLERLQAALPGRVRTMDQAERLSHG